MQKEIKLSGKKIIYQVRKNILAKNIRLTVRPCLGNEILSGADVDFKVLVTTPKWVSYKIGEKFVQDKKEWILAKIDEMSAKDEQSNLRDRRLNYKKDRLRAKKIITSRVHYFGELYGFEIKKIAIRSQRTRWGSCSRDGNLNFNYKLIYLSQEMMDYVIVHELCHLDQFNHSKKFWFLVGEIIPNYKELKRKMKKMII